ncbi:MAG: hypothetical protein ACPGUD_04740 [Parashewanella sp.]
MCVQLDEAGADKPSRASALFVVKQGAPSSNRPDVVHNWAGWEYHPCHSARKPR